MSNEDKSNEDKLAALRTTYEAARAKARAENTYENRAAVIAAWEALDQASPRRSQSGYASRAGMRQARERRTR